MKTILLSATAIFCLVFSGLTPLSSPLQAQTIKNKLGMQFVLIPKGSFTMGSPKSEPGRQWNEKQHRVVISKSFYMQETEVTQGQWEKIMGSNPSEFQNCGEDCPVENVSWNACQIFIKRLGGKFSLPTEAQWEYAARSGGREEIYSGSDDIERVAWYSRNSGMKTHKVGAKAPNGLGLYDMSGNVWEWCQDWRGKYFSNEVKNPAGPLKGSYRVIRGGACYSMASWVRATNRGRFYPEFRYLLTGFRLVHH